MSAYTVVIAPGYKQQLLPVMGFRLRLSKSNWLISCLMRRKLIGFLL